MFLFSHQVQPFSLSWSTFLSSPNAKLMAQHQQPKRLGHLRHTISVPVQQMLKGTPSSFEGAQHILGFRFQRICNYASRSEAEDNATRYHTPSSTCIQIRWQNIQEAQVMYGSGCCDKYPSSWTDIDRFSNLPTVEAWEEARRSRNPRAAESCG